MTITCMNEYQRQAYLSTLGVENYMPRWQLPNAPKSTLCFVPKVIHNQLKVAEALSPQPLDAVSPVHEVQNAVSGKPVDFAEVLRDLTPGKRAPVQSIQERPANIIPLSAEPKTIPGFSLSIWRPQQDLLVLDTRNAQLALPTELLLNNLLRALFGRQMPAGNEDILRWPMVDNTIVSRTIDDARSVLQVWLEVELERRPVKHLLLMGERAAQFFLPVEVEYSSVLFNEIHIKEYSVSAIIAPGLVELLQQPLLKRDLWSALASWHQPV